MRSSLSILFLPELPGFLQELMVRRCSLQPPFSVLTVYHRARICTLHTDFILHDSEFSCPLRLALLFRCVVSTLACPPTVCRILMDLFVSTYSTTCDSGLNVYLDDNDSHAFRLMSKHPLLSVCQKYSDLLCLSSAFGSDLVNLNLRL